MTGTLGLFSLVDLIQLLSGADRTGRLLVQHPRGDAKLYFEDGEIVHALFGDLRGEDAVYALFADEQGAFSFTSGLPAYEKTIELSTNNLVLEAVRRFDEARRDDDAPIPFELDVVPELGGTVDPMRVTLGEDEHRVLAKIDGRRSLQRISELTGLSVETTSRVVGRLVAADVVVVRRRKPRTARLVVDVASFRIPHGTAAVDPTIVRAWSQTLGRRPREVACKRENGRVVTFRLAEGEAVGPYLLLGRFTRWSRRLKTGEALLVRPVEEEA